MNSKKNLRLETYPKTPIDIANAILNEFNPSKYRINIEIAVRKLDVVKAHKLLLKKIILPIRLEIKGDIKIITLIFVLSQLSKMRI